MEKSHLFECGFQPTNKLNHLDAISGRIQKLFVSAGEYNYLK